MFALYNDIIPDLDCGGDIFENEGEITSPNYPGDYNIGETCTWVIHGKKGQIISLVSQDFQTEGGGVNCWNDRLLVK